ncbi:MAG TPA: hypothetical protein VMQ81_03140 [Acidimicrobiia bacterium]|nr:hypothetical protein [Acidimicrobiia bacterium]
MCDVVDAVAGVADHATDSELLESAAVCDLVEPHRDGDGREAGVEGCGGGAVAALVNHASTPWEHLAERCKLEHPLPPVQLAHVVGGADEEQAPLADPVQRGGGVTKDRTGDGRRGGAERHQDWGRSVVQVCLDCARGRGVRVGLPESALHPRRRSC